MIKFASGDIFESPHSLAHGCNCAGGMGKGIALQFKKRYPEMVEYYKFRCKRGMFIMGSVMPFTNDDRRVVYNLGTQPHWRKGAELWAIRDSVETMIDMQRDDEIIAMPRVGAGLGGLDWQDVKDLLLNIDTKGKTIIVAEEYVTGQPLKEIDL